MKLSAVYTHELSPDAHKIRKEVFVDEQGFDIKLEFDKLDKTSVHAVLYANGMAAATGRVYKLKGDKSKHYRKRGKVYALGRIAVAKDFRNQGMGRLIVEKLETYAAKKGADYLAIFAQVQATPFYNKLGYENLSEVVELDEDCPHIRMGKAVKTDH